MNFSTKQLLYGLLILLIPSLGQAQQRGDIFAAGKILTYTKTQLSLIYSLNGIPTFVAPIDYEVDAYKVVYYTLNTQGDSLVLASGLVLSPSGGCELPLMLYCHGTVYYDDDVPSELPLESIIGLPYAANGYMVCMPDYLGLGESAGQHPYIHAKSEATASVDMMRAARNLAADSSITLNNQNFVTGYSQGGHAAMAAFRELEQQHTNEFTVTAAAPASGPYDISGTSRDSLLAERATRPFYMGYIILGLLEAYPDIAANYPDLNQILVEPYDTLVPQLLDRSGPQVSGTLPDTAIYMLQDSVLQAVRTDNLHPFNIAFRDNDLYDWVPNAPLKMYYCEADQDVSYINSVVTDSAMNANGAIDVEALSVGANLDHGGCVGPSIIQAKFFFDTKRIVCTPTSVDDAFEAGLSLSPNPMRTSSRLDLYGFREQIQAIQLIDINGRLIRTYDAPNATELVIERGNLASGWYNVQVIGEKMYQLPVWVQ
ncbi:MAG: lipase family protein [Bacteroidota bacterium]